MLDFPNSPAIGQQFSTATGKFAWDGAKWAPVGTGLGSVYFGDTPPLNPVNGQLWWDTVGCLLYIWYTDPNSSQWVAADNINAAGLGEAPKDGFSYGRVNATWGQVLPLAGGTLTGSLTINYATPVATLNAPASGQARYLLATTAGNNRWAIVLGDSTAETGSNVGSNFQVARWNDAGALIDIPLTINRASGQTTLANMLSVSPAGDAIVLLNKSSSGRASILQGSMNNATRWQIAMGDGAPETGSNVGSDFYILRCNDSGNMIDTALKIVRNSGDATFSQRILSNGYAARAGFNGATSGNFFNIEWRSGTSPHLWVDTFDAGVISVTSDYRTKRNVAELPSLWDDVKLLRPISYTQAEAFGGLFQADDTERWGFLAHELQETLIDSAATGKKDEPHTIQSPNPWTIIAALTKALQEAMERIEALEARPTYRGV